MKKLFYVMLALAALGLSAASCNKVNVGGNGSHYVFTDESENVTAGTAKVNGHYNAPTITGENVGFIYDRQDRFKEKSSPRETTVPTSEGKFWLTFTGLEPNTIYSYIAYANIDGKEERGKAKSFRTEKAVFTDDPQDVMPTSAKLCGHIGEGIDMQETGFLYDLSSSFDIQSATRVPCTPSGQQISIKLNTLPQMKEFAYVAYVKYKNGKEYYGDKKKFTTGQIHVTGLSVSPSGTTLVFGKNETVQLTANIEPAAAAPQDLTWKSSAPSVASVTSSGLVKALTEGKTDITVSLTENGKEFTATCKVTVTAVHVTGVTLDKEYLLIRMKEGTTAKVTATVTPSDASNKEVEWYPFSSDNKVFRVDSQTGLVTAIGSGSHQLHVRTKDGGKTAYCTVYVIKNESPTPVDLGLSVKWAPYDVGSRDYNPWGMYMAWGETAPRMEERYYTDNYHMTANYSTLPSNLDAATVNWGGNWRMPTKAELEELVNNCTWSWDDSQKMYKATRNGKTLQFPAAGYKTAYYVSGEGTVGHYWSSSYVSSDNAYGLVLTKSGATVTAKVQGVARYQGRNIRPVCK